MQESAASPYRPIFRKRKFVEEEPYVAITPIAQQRDAPAQDRVTKLK